MILSDGVIGQMMEKITLPAQKPRLSNEEIIARYGDWATTGKPSTRERNIITSLELDPYRQETHNHKLQAKYKKMEENEVRFEAINCEDADYVIVAYGSSARISQKTMQLARAKGHKVGLFRLISLFPFPKNELNKLADTVKGFLAVEMSAGQMIEDVRLAVNGKKPAEHYGRFGGVVHSPEEVLTALEQKIIGG